MQTFRQCKRQLSLVLLQSVTVLATFTNNFDAYPTNAQSCLYDASNTSNCAGTNVTVMNACLCDNGGGFVINAATCIGKADGGDLETVYSVMAAACAFSKTPLSVSQRDFMAAGNGSLSSSFPSSNSTTTSSHSTATDSTTTFSSESSDHTVTPTSTGGTANNTGGSDRNDDSGGISSTAMIGIIAGAAVAGVAITAALIFFVIRTRRTKQKLSEEHYPMLGTPATGAGSGGTELSRFSGTVGSTYDYKMQDGTGGAKWMPAPTDAYPTAPSTAFYQGQMHSLQLQQTTVFELPAGAPAPLTTIAEMPSTTMAPRNYPHNPHNPQNQQFHQQWGPSEYR